MRRLSIIAAIAIVVITGCGGDPPEARSVTVVGVSTSVPPSATVGAQVTLDGGSVVAPSRADTASYGADASAEERAVTVSADLIPAFFASLKGNDFTKAAAYSSGNALLLVEAIKQQAQCGVRVADATGSAPKAASVTGKNTIETDAKATLRFTNGTTQSVTAVTVVQTKAGAFLVEDLRFGNSTLSQLLEVGPVNGRLENDLRIFTKATCVGTQIAFGAFQVINETESTVNLTQAFYRRLDGSTVQLAVGADTVVGRQIAPGAQVTWNVTISGDRLSNGWLVTTQPDLTGETNRGFVERQLQFLVPPIFSGNR
jgi:hypothetical protein